MPAPCPWTICYTPPGGEQVCFDFGVPLELPEIDEPDPVILDQIKRLQELARQVTEPELRMQLTQALDGAVDRLGAELPAGFEFRRAASHDFPDDPGRFTGVPDVTGLFVVEGWNILNEAGYAVRQKPKPVPADLDGDIVDQDPAGGFPAAPPGPVTIWVGLAFPEPPSPPTMIPPPGVPR